VEALRGQVTLHSPPGEGTVFEVRIPLGQDPGRGSGRRNQGLAAGEQRPGIVEQHDAVTE
jgi:hypothetical protein